MHRAVSELPLGPFLAIEMCIEWHEGHDAFVTYVPPTSFRWCLRVCIIHVDYLVGGPRWIRTTALIGYEPSALDR